MNLVNMDCLDFLSGLSSNSVDMVLVDPPYYGIIRNDWDNQWANEEAYLDWCDKWTRECERVLRPNRMLVVWGTLKTDTFVKYKLRSLSGSALTQQTEIIWHYNWGGRTRKNFARKAELAWCFSKGEDFLFNDQEIRVERKLKKNIRTGKAYEFGTIPTNVWQFQNHTTSKDFCSWHPTTKNLRCLERMILAYTNEGETVMDCFSGSGSTMLAALRANREFLGCEISEEYYKKSLERYEGAK